MSVDNNDRDWLAMQYVLGELSDADRSAFEERLPADLQLCEAVTAASRLVQTAQAALPTPAPIPSQSAVVAVQRESRSKSRRSLFAVIITSTAMAFALLVITRTPQKSLLTPPQPGHDLVSSQNPQAAQLVSLWQSGSDAGNEEPDDLDDLTDAAADVVVPSWMLAAVSIEADDTLHGPSEKVQEN